METPTTQQLAAILSHMEEAKELVQCDNNQDRVLQFISCVNAAMSAYSELHKERAKKSRQSLITRYFTEQAVRAVCVEQRELESVDMDMLELSSDEELDSVFEGFNS